MLAGACQQIYRIDIMKKVIRLSDAFKTDLFTIVDESRRDTFLPMQFGGGVQDFIASGEFERNAYTLARKMASEHKGGEWAMVETKNQSGFFLYPDNDNTYTIEDENENKAHVDAVLFGFIVTLTTLEAGSLRPMAEQELANTCYEKALVLQQAFLDALEKASARVATDEEAAHLRELEDIAFMLSDLG